MPLLVVLLLLVVDEVHLDVLLLVLLALLVGADEDLPLRVVLVDGPRLAPQVLERPLALQTALVGGPLGGLVIGQVLGLDALLGPVLLVGLDVHDDLAVRGVPVAPPAGERRRHGPTRHEQSRQCGGGQPSAQIFHFVPLVGKDEVSLSPA